MIRARFPREYRVYALLEALRLFEVLRFYTPVLVGTIPLGIDTPESDVDVLCALPSWTLSSSSTPSSGAEVIDSFVRLLHECYQCAECCQDFNLYCSAVQGLPTVVCSFVASMPTEHECYRERIEVFAQPLAVEQQNGYRHLVVEARLIEKAEMLGLHTVRQELHQLKRSGLHTEPAFAQYFRLDDVAEYLALSHNPYQALLQLYNADDDTLTAIVQHCARHKQ